MKYIKRITAIIVILVVMIIPISTASEIQNNPQKISVNSQENSKNEVVYATLAPNGEVSAIYVVNRFDIKKSGLINDYGNYQSILNLTEDKKVTQNDDLISFEADSGNFYYQGNMKMLDIPWIFDIEYILDGKKMQPSEIAGKSGKLEIYFKSAKNDKINPLFYENYMLQISVNFNSDKCSNIESQGAVFAEAGSNTMLTFTALPKKNADYYIIADVDNFEMTGIDIAAMPFSMSIEIPETDGMLDDLNKLPEAVSGLNDGIAKLTDGASELNNGAIKLKEGSSDFKSGLIELSGNSKKITDGSTLIKNALLQIESSMNSNTGIDMSSLTQLPAGLSELSLGLKSISNGLTQLKNGYLIAYNALDSAIMSIPEAKITMEQVYSAFPEPNAEQSALLNDLFMSYISGQTVKGTYSQVKEAFASVTSGISEITANIDIISASLEFIGGNITNSLASVDISAQMKQLTDGLSLLTANYKTFDKGLIEYMNGVSSLSNGYNGLDSGLLEFSGGVDEYYNGMNELYDGSKIFKDEVSKIPEILESEISKMTAEYSNPDFAPVSFVSEKNKDVKIVQFVLKIDGIKIPEEIKVVVDEVKKEETIWNRFIALFKR